MTYDKIIYKTALSLNILCHNLTCGVWGVCVVGVKGLQTFFKIGYHYVAQAALNCGPPA
jgi:hypothetical protein